MIITVASEDALLIQLGDEISASLLPRIAALQHLIERELGHWVVDLTPSYTTLLCQYDPLQTDCREMQRELTRLTEQLDVHVSQMPPGKTIEIPVWYDPEVGYDLVALAASKALTVETLIERHSGTTYQVFALGFSPGFAFLGSVTSSLVSPRHSTPRRAVAAGSVGIAETQTAVYPRQSPGGWQIIGRSPMTLFNPRASIEQAALLQVGDRVRFSPIDRATFIELGGQL